MPSTTSPKRAPALLLIISSLLEANLKRMAKTSSGRSYSVNISLTGPPNGVESPSRMRRRVNSFLPNIWKIRMDNNAKTIMQANSLLLYDFFISFAGIESGVEWSLQDYPRTAFMDHLSHDAENGTRANLTQPHTATASAWSMSARMSSMCSMPTLRRTRSGVMPPAACCSGLSWLWVVLALWMARDLASPTLAK